MKRSRAPRENLALRTSERWQPPAYVVIDGWRSRALAAVRRFFDLQAGSVWSDLGPVLGEATGTLVDVGCGAQPYRPLLAPTVAYIGLDTADALAHFGYEMPDVRLIAADGGWPVADAGADSVLATETLEHVADPPAFLAEAMRVLRPGGQLILTVPFQARWHYVPHDYWRFTPSGLRLVLERAGFTDVIVHGRGNAVTVACYKVLGLLLGVIIPQSERGAPRVRPVALPLAPLVVALAALGNRTLRMPAGEDALGYTALAVNPFTAAASTPPSAGTA
jgi:SAM-dependent methyltransferase